MKLKLAYADFTFPLLSHNPILDGSNTAVSTLKDSKL